MTTVFSFCLDKCVTCHKAILTGTTWCLKLSKFKNKSINFVVAKKVFLFLMSRKRLQSGFQLVELSDLRRRRNCVTCRDADGLFGCYGPSL